MTVRSARFSALIAAVLFSTGGAAIKVAAFSAAQVSCFRSGLAAAVLFAWYGRRLVWTRWTVPAGLVYAATLTLFVAATKLTTAANAIYLQATAPIYILLLGPWLLREHVSRRDVFYLLSTGAGMVCCFVGQPRPTTIAPNPALGNLLGVASGLSWALTLIALRRLNRDVAASGHRAKAGFAAVIAGNAIACAIALPFALRVPHATAIEWSTVVYLGVVQVALAYVFLTAAVRVLPAFELSLLLLLEPVLNPFWTWLVRGEHPGAWTLAGGAIIVAVTGIRTRPSATAGQETGAPSAL